MVLGVAHGPKLAAFQAEMRDYLPRGQAALLRDLAAELAATPAGGLRALAMADGAPARLRAAYEGACGALRALRAYHLGIATHFLRRALKGTGGSDFRAMLDEGVSSTRMACTAART